MSEPNSAESSIISSWLARGQQWHGWLQARGFAYFLVVYALFVWLMLLILPVAPPGLSLDASWQAVLHFAAAHDWQFGRDVTFTFGPLGYYQSSIIYNPETYLACILYQTLYKAYYVGLIVCLAVRLPRRAAVVFLLINTLLPLIDDVSIYLLTIAYSAILLCGEKRADRWWTLPTLVFLAIGALMKEVNLVYGVFMLGCVGVYLLTARRGREIWLLAVGFVLLFLLADVWLGGQSLRYLPIFLRDSLDIVGGYAEAMATRPAGLVSLGSSVLAVALVGFRLARAALWPLLIRDGTALAASERNRRWAILLIWGAGLFIAWKQGFTRADSNHQITFFIYALAIDAAAMAFFPFGEVKAAAAGSPRLVPQTALLVPLLVAWSVFEDPSWRFIEHVPLPQRIETNLRWLVTPGNQRRDMERMTREVTERAALPRCRAVIGRASVDVFGYDQSITIFNGWNYRPAPVFQSYCAYTPHLAELNASYYRSAHAPEFVLFKPGNFVDGHYPNLENAKVLTSLLRGYRPLFVEKDFLLLQRKTGAGAASSSNETAQPLASGVLRIGDKLPLPPSAAAIWCEFDVRPNLLGRLVSFFFQPEICTVNVYVPGRAMPVLCRIVPGMAKAGFLLTPAISSPSDYLRALAGQAEGQRITAVQIPPNQLYRLLMRNDAQCRLYQLPTFASPEDGPKAAELLGAPPAPPPAQPPASAP